jgi:hypothetical protein
MIRDGKLKLTNKETIISEDPIILSNEYLASLTVTFSVWIKK